MPPSQVNPKAFRDRRKLVAARLSEWSAPLLSSISQVLVRRPSTPPSSWRRGILLGADHIGDVLYNTASLPALTKGLPDCEWYYVAAPPATGVLANNPYLKSCIPSLESLASIDVAICYNSGGYWRELLRVIRQGIPNRVGYVHKGFSALVTQPIQIIYPQPYPAYFRDLVAQLTGYPADWSLRPRIYPGSADEERANRVWNEASLDQRPVVACFLTSRQASGVWPARRFAETVAHLEAEGLCQTVLCGTAGDASLLEELKGEFSLRGKVLAGVLDLLPLGCFLRKCATVLCPDSGPRHIANAVKTPVVFVRNFAVGKIETGAYCESEIDAAPVLERVPPRAQERAFAALRPETVAALVRQQVATGLAMSRGSR